MHELSVTENIVQISREEAEKHGASKVKEIRIRVGELSGLLPECIQFYFDIVSAGTVVGGAVLKIEKVPATIRCKDCGYEEPHTKRQFVCSSCGSSNIRVEKGNEFLIDSLEVE